VLALVEDAVLGRVVVLIRQLSRHKLRRQVTAVDTARALAEQRWGDLLELTSFLATATTTISSRVSTRARAPARASRSGATAVKALGGLNDASKLAWGTHLHFSSLSLKVSVVQKRLGMR
jgi:hypothetical protein